MLGIDFNRERTNGELKKDEKFKNSIWKKLGYTNYFCPKCSAHLREANNGDIICLNGCHMTEEMRSEFSKEMQKIVEKHKSGGE